MIDKVNIGDVVGEVDLIIDRVSRGHDSDVYCSSSLSEPETLLAVVFFHVGDLLSIRRDGSRTDIAVTGELFSFQSRSGQRHSRAGFQFTPFTEYQGIAIETPDGRRQADDHDQGRD